MTPVGQPADDRAEVASRQKISAVIACSSLYWERMTYTVPVPWNERAPRAILSFVLTHGAVERGGQRSGPLDPGLGQPLPGGAALIKVHETYEGSVPHVVGTVNRMRGE